MLFSSARFWKRAGQVLISRLVGLAVPDEGLLDLGDVRGDGRDSLRDALRDALRHALRDALRDRLPELLQHLLREVQ